MIGGATILNSTNLNANCWLWLARKVQLTLFTMLALTYCVASIKKKIWVLSFPIICLYNNLVPIIYIQGIRRKVLGLLKRTCPLLKGTKVRRTLYLSLVKSQLSYAIEFLSPADTKLTTKVKRVSMQRQKLDSKIQPDLITRLYSLQ